MRDLAVALALGLQLTDPLTACSGQSRSTQGIARRTPEGRHTPFLQPPLLAPHCPLAAAEGARHLHLGGVALLDQTGHGPRLPHAIIDGVVRHHDAPHRHDHVAVLLAPPTASADPPVVGRERGERPCLLSAVRG